jgi:hypothetical protein
MAKRYTEISEKLQQFIQQQPIFFVGTAANEGRVNVSPKGMDTFRILNPNKIVWLNLIGSGNETAAHLMENERMTIMFCAFAKESLILRLYGHAKIFHQKNVQWNELISLFPPFVGARQIIEVEIDLVLTSCGMAVPRFEFVEERQQLKEWAEKKGSDGLKKYWEQKNQISLDGKPIY